MEIKIGFRINTIKSSVQRNEKGKNLLAFPDEFIVVDLETTGFSPQWDSIIELSAIKVKNNQPVESFSTLCNEDHVYIDEYITELTGITQEMVNDAPPLKETLLRFMDFVGDGTIVGHNVNFDINFLYDKSMYYFSKPFRNNFIDTMRISRRLHSTEAHHRLTDLTTKYGITYENAHRAEIDCLATYKVYLALIKDILNSYDTLDYFCKIANSTYKGIKASDIHASTSEFDILHPLYNKVCVFTGRLDKLPRKDAMQIVANLGGINGDNVTKKTNYLILGNNDYCKTIKDGKSSKQKKAEKLKASGQDIEILSEDVFYDMIFNN